MRWTLGARTVTKMIANALVAVSLQLSLLLAPTPAACTHFDVIRMQVANNDD